MSALTDPQLRVLAQSLGTFKAMAQDEVAAHEAVIDMVERLGLPGDSADFVSNYDVGEQRGARLLEMRDLAAQVARRPPAGPHQRVGAAVDILLTTIDEVGHTGGRLNGSAADHAGILYELLGNLGVNT